MVAEVQLTCYFQSLDPKRLRNVAKEEGRKVWDE
jgi:hypothetical protein